MACACFITCFIPLLSAQDQPEGNTTVKSATGYWAANTNVLVIGAEDYRLTFGGKGAENGRFTDPAIVAVAPDGVVFVVEYQANRIQRFSPDGVFLSLFTPTGSASSSSGGISDLAIGPDGAVFIAESTSGRIIKCAPDGTEIDFLDVPTGVTVDAIAVGLDGALFVVSTGSHLVHRYDADFNPLGSFGGEGTGPAKLRGPSAIAIGPDGNVWICDRLNYRVQKFSADGRPLLRFGSQGIDVHQFGYLRDLAAGPDGSVYVVDSGAPAAIKQFDGEGNLLRVITSLGELGTLSHREFIDLEGIAVDREGNAYIADPFHHEIHKLGPVAYTGSGPTGIIRGLLTREMTNTLEANQVAVRLDAVDAAGNGFYAMIIPDERGRFLFKRVPLNSTWKLSVIWFDHSRFRSAPLSYSGLLIEGPDRANDFRITPLPQ